MVLEVRLVLERACDERTKQLPMQRRCQSMSLDQQLLGVRTGTTCHKSQIGGEVEPIFRICTQELECLVADRHSGTVTVTVTVSVGVGVGVGVGVSRKRERPTKRPLRRLGRLQPVQRERERERERPKAPPNALSSAKHDPGLLLPIPHCHFRRLSVTRTAGVASTV